MFLIEMDDLSNRTCTVAQLPAHFDQLFEHKRRTRNGLEHQRTAALHALGEGHLLVPLKQSHSSHLAKIEQDWIAGLVRKGCSVVEFRLFKVSGIFSRLAFHVFSNPRQTACRHRYRSVFVDADVVALEGGEQPADLRGGVRLAGQDFVHFVKQDIAPFLAHVDEPAKPVILFLKYRRQMFLP